MQFPQAPRRSQPAWADPAGAPRPGGNPANTDGSALLDLEAVTISGEATGLLDPFQARRHGVLPFTITATGLLRIAVAPGKAADLNLRDDLARATGHRRLELVEASQADIEAKIGQVYAAELVADLTAESTDATEAAQVEVVDTASDSPAARLVRALLTQAISERATDVHLEPWRDHVGVRFRIDRRPYPRKDIPLSAYSAVVTVLKVMAGMKIDVRATGQDGRIDFPYNGRTIDLRVATIPVMHGEQVILRVLDKTSANLTLAAQGFSAANLARYRALFTKPAGTLLIVGPTGSGKSTTMRGTVAELNQPDTKILSIEDPVEFEVPGIGQVQVNEAAGMTYNAALKMFLRGDPDKLIVGEMRDPGTARTAMDFALTGHLVVSTLHAVNAPAALTRLTKMGVDPDVVADAISGVVAQRLLGRLCDRCKIPATLDMDRLATLGLTLPEGAEPTAFNPVGCSACLNQGYRGMIAAHEVLVVDEGIAEMVADRAPTARIRAHAVAGGMEFIRQDALGKVLAGVTTLDEVAQWIG